jgi:hypothetical protein
MGVSKAKSLWYPFISSYLRLCVIPWHTIALNIIYVIATTRLYIPVLTTPTLSILHLNLDIE